MQVLKDECIDTYGLVDNEIRKKAWPLLLNLESLYLEKKVDLNETATSFGSLFESTRFSSPPKSRSVAKNAT